MKRILSLLLSVFLLLGLTQCTHPDHTVTDPTDAILQTQSASTTPTTSTVTQPTQSQPTEPEQTITTEPMQPPTLPSLPEPDPNVAVEVGEDVLVRVSDYIPGAQQLLAYATQQNFTGKKIYDFEDAYLRYGTVKKLKAVFDELVEQGIGILIWDGFRPLSAQAMLWERCPNETYVSNPVTGKCTHCRGNAVDLTLIDLYTGQELEMPSEYDDFSSLADRDYSDCSPEAASNALLLQTIMEKHGFIGYSSEWWHFTDTVTYDKESWFDPGMGTLWYPVCNEYLNLRATASSQGEILGKVYPDDELVLLGWSAYYAKVRVRGMEGYVRSTYIKPLEDGYFENRLETVQYTDVYTYEQMMQDLESLARSYPDVVELEMIGSSELGKDLPVLRIGDENAKHHVLFHAAIHGREYTTSWLVMALCDYWLDHGISGFGDVCYHIVPMVNPDGVQIAQTGQLNAQQMQIYLSDLAKGYTSLDPESYARLWKANGVGIDLNRNFDAGWETIRHRTGPSAMLYGGETPFSASEAAALYAYTLRYNFGVTISYHSMGSILYYEYGSNKTANALSKSLGKTVREFTGYTLVGSDSVDAGGYKDWAIDKLGIPSLTVEIASTSPVDPDREMISIFARNYNIFPAVALWLQQQN